MSSAIYYHQIIYTVCTLKTVNEEIWFIKITIVVNHMLIIWIK